jgi:hypothetical protein
MESIWCISVFEPDKALTTSGVSRRMQEDLERTRAAGFQVHLIDRITIRDL